MLSQTSQSEAHGIVRLQGEKRTAFCQNNILKPQTELYLFKAV